MCIVCMYTFVCFKMDLTMALRKPLLGDFYLHSVYTCMYVCVCL